MDPPARPDSYDGPGEPVSGDVNDRGSLMGPVAEQRIREIVPGEPLTYAEVVGRALAEEAS